MGKLDALEYVSAALPPVEQQYLQTGRLWQGFEGRLHFPATFGLQLQSIFLVLLHKSNALQPKLQYYNLVRS